MNQTAEGPGGMGPGKALGGVCGVSISELNVPTVTLIVGSQLGSWIVPQFPCLESASTAGFPGSCSADVLAEAVGRCSGISLCLGLSFPTCDSTFLGVGLSHPIPCALRWEEAVGSAALPAVMHI